MTHTASRPAPVAGALALAGIVVVALLVLAAVVTADAMRQLHIMSSTIVEMNGRLGRLADMDRKLDKLGAMQTQLGTADAGLAHMQSQLQSMNGKLTDADGQIRSMNRSMQTLDGDLRSMRGDIHEMAHKLGGSFLFRGVK